MSKLKLVYVAIVPPLQSLKIEFTEISLKRAIPNIKIKGYIKKSQIIRNEEPQ